MKKDFFICDSNLTKRKIYNFVYNINYKYKNISIYLGTSNRMVNAHSILGMLSLKIKTGDTITVISYCDSIKFNDIFDFIKSNL